MAIGIGSSYNEDSENEDINFLIKSDNTDEDDMDDRPLIHKFEVIED